MKRKQITATLNSMIEANYANIEAVKKQALSIFTDEYGENIRGKLDIFEEDPHLFDFLFCGLLIGLDPGQFSADDISYLWDLRDRLNYYRAENKALERAKKHFKECEKW